ncbi:hypothetical protein [Burkholderia guangdongensis]|uniref:hypothetical protein n=1 Tax=Burkholderia guangdongensis TaxID=1792500 RepID=UPI0015CE1692|nr:hypothetical protein [Burkholderia guangdongensis]
MSLLSKRTAQIAKAVEAVVKIEGQQAKEESGTFFANNSDVAAARPAQRWRTEESTAHQPQRTGDEMLQQSIPAPDAHARSMARTKDIAAQPTDARRPEHVMRPKATHFDTGTRDPLFDLSTHRAAQRDPVEDAERKRQRKEEQERRAWDGFAFLMSLLSIGSGRG